MPNAKPLYKQPNPMYDRQMPSIKDFCQPTCGAMGEDLRFTDLDSVNGCRMTKGAKTVHRIAANVKPMGGHMRESQKRPAGSRTYSKKEMRALAIKVLRQRGDQITDDAIAGILSGRTL